MKLEKRNNRTCVCCGKTYTYCPNCGKDAAKPVWMNTFHDENCKTIFYAITDYLAGSLNKTEAKKILSKCTINRTTRFKGNISETIDIIMASDKPPTAVKKPVKEIKSDAQVTTDDINSLIEQ